MIGFLMGVAFTVAVLAIVGWRMQIADRAREAAGRAAADAVLVARMRARASQVFDEAMAEIARERMIDASRWRA